MTEHRERTVEEAEDHKNLHWGNYALRPAMTKQQQTALNMAKFIQGQSLLLLDKLNELNLDADADLCEALNEQAELLYSSLSGQFENLKESD